MRRQRRLLGTCTAVAAARRDLRVPLLVALSLFALTLAVTSRAGAAPTFEEQVMEIVNQERWNNGQLPPLKQDVLLDTAAELHSTNMAIRDFFAHCDVDTGLGPSARIAATGYAASMWAENIAAGYPTPAAVMQGWMASSGHRANILRTTVRELGIGYYQQAGDQANVRRDQDSNCVADGPGTQGPFANYWTQSFGTRSSVYPVVIEREAYETADPNVALYLYGAGWAQEMRLRNDGGLFTPWMPFATDYAWQLGLANGVRTVTVELRNGATVRSASDSIVLTGVFPEIFDDGFESGSTSAWALAE